MLASMMRWLIVILATVTLLVVGAVAIRCQPVAQNWRPYMAQCADPVLSGRFAHLDRKRTAIDPGRLRLEGLHA